MRKIYNVIVEDRHADVIVYPYLDPDKAVEEAKRLAKEWCRNEGYYQELEIEGWLFCASYSSEGDSVRVTAAEIQDADT